MDIDDHSSHNFHQQDPFKELRKHSLSTHPDKLRLNITLAAIVDVIRERRTEESKHKAVSNTEYFAALMTALESEEASHVHEIILLLSIVLPHVSEAVLRSRFSAISNSLCRSIQENVSRTSTLKNGINAIGSVLAAQEATNGFWGRPAVLKVFHLILGFSSDQRPKIRRASQCSIVLVLKNHKAHKCETLSTHVGNFIENVVASTSEKEISKTLQLLSFVGPILPLLPITSTSSLCSVMIKLLKMDDKTVFLTVLQNLDTLLSNENTLISSKSLREILTKLCSMDLGVQDGKIGKLCSRVFSNATTLYCKMEKNDIDNILPKAILSLCSLFQSQDIEAHSTVARSLNYIISNCLTKDMVDRDLLIEKQNNQGTKPMFFRIRCSLESLLSLRYQHAWLEILPALGGIFKHFGTRSAEALCGLLRSAAEMHEATTTMSNSSGVYQKLFAGLIGDSIEAMGPKHFLSIISLTDPQTNLIPESCVWLIPILREHSKQYPTELAVFSNEILKIARACEDRSKEVDSSSMEANQLRIRTLQLWSLFPSFCFNASDVSTEFKSIAKMLANAMSDKKYPELCLIVCQGLQNLCKTCTAIEDISVLSKYSKRYLPILFDIVEGLDADSESDNLNTLIDCISGMASITDKEFLSKELFKQLIQQLLESSTKYKQLKTENKKSNETVQSGKKARLLMCIAVALVPSLDIESIKFLYRVAYPFLLDDEDAVMQKRAYTILVSICDHHADFISDKDNLKSLIDSLCESLMTCSIPSRKMRLKCLVKVINAMETSGMINIDNIPSLVGEIMLCTKESNGKAREAAFELLIAMGKLMSMSDRENGFSTYIQMILGGLAAQTPHMRSASVLSMSRIVFEFGRKEPAIAKHMPDLLQTILLLLHEKAREVIKSVIGFLKLAIAIIPIRELKAFVPEIIEGLLVWVGESKNRFRGKTRIILMKLCRKFGYDHIMTLVPEKDQKLITHIKKTKEREDKKKEQSKNDLSNQTFDEFMQSDDENDSDNEESSHQPEKSNISLKKAWICENTKGGEIVDFLDHSAIKNIISKDPNESEESDIEFDTSKDGKMIIPDDAPQTDKEDNMNIEEEVKMELASQLKQMGFPQHNNKRQDRKRKSNSMESGNDYKAKKAGGDIKKKGKLEPYAYISLDPKSMSKRHKRSAVSRFNNIGKGSKQKSKSRK